MAADSTIQAHISLQANKHGLVTTAGFRTLEEYFLFLMHIKAYEEAAQLGQGKRVLDYGCNNGYGTGIIASKCGRVTGIDVSPTAISHARGKFSSDNADFVLYDGTRLPFPDKTFDLVVSLQVIEHIKDYQGYLSEIKRVLAPGGQVLFTTPNAAVRLDEGMKPWYPFHIREFTAGQLKELLSVHFQQVQILGLFANEPMYSTQINLFNSARMKNRSRSKLESSVRSGFRKILPLWTINLIRTSLSLLKGRRKLDGVTLARYSTSDLFYRNENLDAAMDLMAICTASGS